MSSDFASAPNFLAFFPNGADCAHCSEQPVASHGGAFSDSSLAVCTGRSTGVVVAAQLLI